MKTCDWCSAGHHRKRFCSQACNHAHWKNRNREYANAYDRQWRKETSMRKAKDEWRQTSR